MKRIGLLLLAALLLAGCTAAPVETTAPTTTVPVHTEPPTTVASVDTVGICLPDENVPRWRNEATYIQASLEELGYSAQVVYAAGDPAVQASQMEQLVQEGVRCLIVVAIDGAELLEAAETARVAGVPVVAYDRLLMDTEAVCAYVGFDYRQMGRDMGNYITETKMLEETQKDDAFSVEFFMGSPEDPNALALYEGLMEILQPYFESDALVTATGRTAFEDCCIVDWNAEEAGGRFARYLAQQYTEDLPDIVCTASDAMADKCLAVLAGLENPPEQMPLVTGIGGELSQGQGITFSLETHLLAEPAARIADQLITGQDLTVTDPEGCDNRAAVIPAWFAPAEQIAA